MSSKTKSRRRNNRRPLNAGTITTAMVKATSIASPEPLRFNSTPTVDLFMQYRVYPPTTGLVNYVIRASDVLSQHLMCYATTAVSVSGYPIFSRFLYKSVRLLAIQSNTSLRFSDNAGSALNSEKTSSDNSDSADRYAVSKISPRPNQQAGQWQNFLSGSGAFAVSTASNGATSLVTLELHIVAQLNNGGDASEGVLVFNNNPGIVIGQVFSPTLDVSGDAIGYFHRVGFLSVADLATATPRP